MLLSFLTVERFDLPFNNLRDLLKNTDYNIAIIPGSISEAIFKDSLDPNYQEAWKDRIEPYLEDYLPYAKNADHMMEIFNQIPRIALYITENYIM